MSIYKTPLRYPGGKQKLTPFIVEVIRQNDLLGGHYAEPYAGGAGIAIELVLQGIVSTIHLNDSCKAVYSFWFALLNYPEDFCRRISRASMSIEEWRRQRSILMSPNIHDKLDFGFAMFYLNRCNRSGILNAGVIGGLNQSGHWKMDARFPRNELIRRVEAIASKKRSIKIRNWDAERFIKEYLPKTPARTIVYIDPPYFHKAERLYLNHYKHDDHNRIAKIIQRDIQRPWVVSYDHVPEIQTYYSKRRSFTYALQYNAAKAYKGTEIFVFSDNLKIPRHSALPNIDNALCACNF